MDYKSTLNLPVTAFPMRANSAVREPELQAFWDRERVYEQLLESHRKGPRFLLHDGPPYSSSGKIHIGHALNKILKDMVVKHRALLGYYAPFVPGYDTHGLPTEIAALKELKDQKKALAPLEIRTLCKEFAQKSISGQHTAFKRLGIFADWEHPYVTMQPEFEATQIRVFGEMAAKGHIYKGLKPVYWCSTCVTALAEAEVEYDDHASPSIYVEFPLIHSDVPQLQERLAAGRSVYLVIWTTTPWTLPANMAIAVHPDFEYTVIETDRGDLVVARERVHAVTEAATLADARPTDLVFKGKELEHSRYRHAFLDRESPVILAPHVTLESGSGLVHTAPGHGQEDYVAGQLYKLPVFAPLDDRGVFTPEAGELVAGQFYAKANPIVVSRLEELGRLLAADSITHSYPHCWRCHKPIIFRATEQWFASIEGFRQQALDEIRQVHWHPAYGEVRISNMVENRSDWCVSRQRTWGVPIPVFYCQSCDTPLITPETTDRVASVFAQEGSDAWWRRDACDLLPAGTRCGKCGLTDFRKEKDIMDVWFDSGVTHEAVCARRDLGWPADLYLEGSDQYRGWFQSSLLTAVATRGKAPYRMVIKHGFALDPQGRKMSKSLGNVVDPYQVLEKYGADVLRLWVSSVDYTEDVKIGEGILQQLAEVYRKIRNTARFLLANLADYDPRTMAVPDSELREIDRFALHRLQEVTQQVRGFFETYEYNGFYSLIQNYCVVDLSSFYLDVIKDRLYASAEDAPGRRAAQGVLHQILMRLMRLIAPVLSHLAEDIYQHLPFKTEQSPTSVFLLDFPEVEERWRDPVLADRWARVLELREKVNKALEEARQQKLIGSAVDALVTVPATERPDFSTGAPEEVLREALNVSQVEIAGSEISVEPAPGVKCARCWLILPTIGQDPAHQELCPRCAAAVGGQLSGIR